MVRKNAKRFLSILLSVLLVSSFFTMNISAAEENVASIGDVYYNSVEDALEAAVSGDKVIVQKDTTITRDVTVPAGVTLLVPHKDGYTGYDLASGTPDLSAEAKNVTDVLYRTLTVNEGVTVTVNGTNYQIQRGVQVMVPRCVALVLERSRLQELAAQKYMESLKG